ncbi:MAG TPA: TonB-dependent receptor [Candidatus Kapabacteria bacterium]|nr:TonB-dependent receptor [Candidatus Kapabacteria bacterium]
MLVCSFRDVSNAAITAVPYSTSVVFRVFVRDAEQGEVLAFARIRLRGERSTARVMLTDSNGLATFENLDTGRYIISISFVNYIPFLDTIIIDETHLTDTIVLHESPHEEIVVQGNNELPATTYDSSGNQVFKPENYHPPPVARMTQLIQQNLLGAVRAPTGEVHIRGQHGEFSYIVDGAPVSLGIFGGLNEIVDPAVIERATFWTGGWPAEYGGQMAAIIDVKTRVPTGMFNLSGSTYTGSYTPNSPKAKVISPDQTVNSNGEQISMSDHLDRLGWFLSGTRQETDRRIDVPQPKIFHDHGFDYSLFGKVDYLLSDKEYLTLDINYGNTATQVPYDSVETGRQDDMEKITEAFQTLSYYRTFSSETSSTSNLLVSLFFRESALTYTPGLIDQASFHFANDSVHGYVIGEDQNFLTTGTLARLEKRWSHEFLSIVGLNFSATSGKQDFSSRDSLSNPGPESLSDYKGSDFSAFGQIEWFPKNWMRIDAGIRYDQQIAPDIAMEKQLSPRVKLNIFFDEDNTAYMYYGRLFMPNTIMTIRSFTSNGNTSEYGTVAEQDNFYEAVYRHHFDFGVGVKIAYYHKDSNPGVDDETVGVSAVKIPFNLEFVHSQGIELGLNYNVVGFPLSGYINSSISHVYSAGLLTGGFLPIYQTGSPVDRDHDQRLSAVISANYQPKNWYVNVTSIYGSGLSNANLSIPFGTGLFNFNQAGHVTPSWIVNVAIGWTLLLGPRSSIQASLFITNLFDHEHLLKGAYTNGPSWEEPRNIILKLTFHLR